MNFTIEGYRKLIKMILDNNYSVSDYKSWESENQCVILRHDIDYEPSKALDLARIENEIGVKSTYFVLLTSDFYNSFSKTNRECWESIMHYGHEIGLHFDEVQYPEIKNNMMEMRERILEESHLLEKIINRPVNVVSMHRPSKAMLDEDLCIPGMINSYGSVFFREFKYLSDSRKRWREPVEDIIRSKKDKRLHILTHAFWYGNEDADIHDSILQFVNNGSGIRYQIMRENITDLGSIMKESEISR